MKSLNLLFCAFVLFSFFACKKNPVTEPEKAKAVVSSNQEKPDYVLVIHGGAGTILKKNMDPETEKSITAALNEALTIGENILKGGGTSLDAITKTINHLENSPFFNAGKGAVFTNAGTNELDASIMDGKTQNAGAVGGVKTIKNPIDLARAVMDDSPHVMLSGEGAENFAKEQGIEQVEPSYFYTKKRFDSLQKIKAKAKQTGYLETYPDWKYGTVGAAALDKNGNLAAGTSTGGMTNKKWGRIGDAPIIGAGTYANNETCALSSTGHGEYFIRYAVAYDISAMTEYTDKTFQEAADFVINQKLKSKGGSGGVIGVDKDGNVAMPFNTEGMYRGYVKPGERVVKIYKE